jgi:hypothetical protein
MNVRSWTRALVALLALMEGIVGIWATFAPLSFFEDGPVPGTGWVALLPPYNEHLVRDYGSMTLGMTCVLVVTAVKLTPLLVRTSMAALLLFAVPHTVFHIFHLENFSPSAAIAQTTTLLVTLVVPVALIVMAGSLKRAPARV